MSTKQRIEVTQATGNEVRIGLTFRFSSDDPRAERIYGAIGECLKIALTPEECQEFMQRFEQARAKLHGGAS